MVDADVPARPHKCTWGTCTKDFKRRAHLRVHLRIHTKEKPFVCQHRDCGKSFRHQSALKNHISRHTDRRRLPCPVTGCGTFIQESFLIWHLAIHSGQMRLKCEEPSCGKSFYNSSAFTRHRCKQQTENPGYQCTVDGSSESFCNDTLLLEHQRQSHQPEIYSRNIDDTSSGSDDQEIPELQRLSITESLDDVVSVGNHGSFYANSKCQVDACRSLPQQYQRYPNPGHWNEYSNIHGSESEEVESPAMEVYAVDGTPVWSRSYITPYAHPIPSTTIENGFFLPATLPTDPVAEVQAGMPQCQESMQSNMVYAQQEQGPCYQLSAF